MTLYLRIAIVVTIVFKVSTQCDHGEVRLVGGSGPHEGRVEICMNSQWGRVCSSSWDDNDALVVCRQLGYSIHGATTSGAEFGQGEGPSLLDNVNCYQIKKWALLECKSAEINSDSCRNHDAGVKCRDEQRVRNVSAHIVNTMSSSTAYTILVTWEQNLTVEEPTSFKVECHSEQHRIIIKIGNKNLSTQLGGLLPCSSYNCCVSAVYPPYEDKEICTSINSTSNVMCSESYCTNSANIYIISGVPGFIIAVLIILLVIASIHLLRPASRKRLIPQRYSIMAATSHSAISGTTTQAIGVTKEDELAAIYCSLDPIYQALSTDSRRSDGKNKVLLNERRECADMPCHVENGGVSTEENIIFPGQEVLEHEH